MPHTNRTSRHDLPGDADRLSYHPDRSSDWSDPDPLTVQQGLDDLSAAATAAALPIVDSTALVQGSADATKQIRLEADSLTSGATRVITMPDNDVDLGTDFAAASHNHNASDINAGMLALARGGANADVSGFAASELVRLNAAATALESAGRSVADLHADIGCRAYHDVDQAVADSTWTALALNQERWDTDSIHDLSTNNSRLTAKTAGVYLIEGGVITDSTEAVVWILRIVLNGTTTLRRFTNKMDRHQMCLATIYKLAVNDYVELEMWHSAGVSKNARVLANWSVEFAIQLIAKT